MQPIVVKSFIGLILIIATFYSLVWNTPFLILIEAVVIGLRGIYELVRLNSKNRWESFIFTSLGTVLGLLFLYQESTSISFVRLMEWNLFFLLLGVLGMFLLIQGKKSGLLLAHFWISIPLFSIWLGHRYWVQSHHLESVLNPLCLFIGAISGGDSLAMFAGKFAKNKIFVFPKISPNKTLQGTIGYLVGTHIIALSYCYGTGLPLSLGLGIAQLSFVFGLGGDLLESALKRKYATKDTGNLIPGHGGVLDRLDSIFLGVIPCILYYLYMNHP